MDAAVQEAQIRRRRTFAIISHPDAGKTTLTEKFLLYGGAIQLAGHVRAKKERRATRSDWMEIEKERGISVSSTALQFEYRGMVFNLLDTPGHQDFSEDTYRTLMAADSAIMVLDAAKGVEPQTRKLFAICRERGIPILTFINKMDRPARDPFDLLDEVEKVLGITAVPVVWPMGSGELFRGFYDILDDSVHWFDKSAGGKFRAPVAMTGIDDPKIIELLGQEEFDTFREGIELSRGALPSFSREQYLAGQMSPVFFGSAVNNFGIELMLTRYAELAPSPRPTRLQNGGELPTVGPFSGFVFKLQANMNKAHRDRVAFIRITSGAFERGMSVTVPRLGREVKLSSPVAFFGQDRNVIDTAYAGDVIGLINPGLYRIGDILAEGAVPDFKPLPMFAPEMFARVVCADTQKMKQFRKGVEELIQEGVIQVFNPTDHAPILGAVGGLQFEVFVYRLDAEYGAPAKLESMPYKLSRWVRPSDLGVFGAYDKLVKDVDGHDVVLFESEFRLRTFRDKHPKVLLAEHPGDLG